MLSRLMLVVVWVAVLTAATEPRVTLPWASCASTSCHSSRTKKCIAVKANRKLREGALVWASKLSWAW